MLKHKKQDIENGNLLNSCLIILLSFRVGVIIPWFIRHNMPLHWSARNVSEGKLDG